MEHGLKSVNNVDAILQYPWKIYALRLWTVRFLFPAIHDHHDNEEKIFGPHFAALGSIPVFGETKNHKELLETMDILGDTIGKLSEELTKVNNNCKTRQVTEDERSNLGNSIKAIYDAFATFKEYMLIHLREEEITWPPILAIYGPKEEQKVVAKILAAGNSVKGDELIAQQNYFGSVMEAMGCNYAYPNTKNKPAVPSTALFIPAWAHPDIRQSFFENVPWFVRKFIFSSWQREYIVRWKSLIDSVAGKTNTFGVTAEGFPSNDKACCIIM